MCAIRLVMASIRKSVSLEPATRATSVSWVSGELKKLVMAMVAAPAARAAVTEPRVSRVCPV